jgi:hypothetical protein
VRIIADSNATNLPIPRPRRQLGWSIFERERDANAAQARPRHADYEINLDDTHGQLAVIDITAAATEHEPWVNQTITRVNDAVVR